MLARTVIVLLLTSSAFGQSITDTPAPEATHYPKLVRAELPLYPAIPWTAHISGTVEIQVTVEKGVVVNAQVKGGTVETEVAAEKNAVRDAQVKLLAYLSNPSLANIKTWKFQSESRTIFVVTYVYRIEGEQTALPENPKIELDLPRLVKVTARPFKPTCSDCGADISGKPVGR